MLKISKTPVQSGAALPASTNQSAPATQTQPTGKTPVPGKVASFMKTGAAAKEIADQEAAKIALSREQAGSMFRFWMKDGSERKITFLDGALDGDGMLDLPRYYEHKVQLAGDWKTFVCTSDQEPCPICERGVSRASYVGVLTVLDHTTHTIKSGPNAGKQITNSRKLYVCTNKTIQQLTKIAVKRGGLAGCTFEVSRGTEKDPNVGSQFDFVEKLETRTAIAQKYGLNPEDVQPADYAKEIKYLSAAELVSLGVGKSVAGVGHEKGLNTAGLADQL